jgi:S-formylglutathione hydrolase FrmB
MAHTREIIYLESAALGRSQPVTLLVPDRTSSTTAWHTLFLLHGMGGDHTRWVENSDIAENIDGKPILVVAPSCQDSFYLDSPEAMMETFICTELLAYCDATYPTIQKPTARGLSGYSMGGYGAMILALRNPHLFGSAVSHSGAVLTSRATHEAGVKWELADTLYGTGPEGEINRAEHDILTLTQKLLKIDPRTGRSDYTGPALYFDCGADDFLFYASRELTQALRMLHIPYQFHEYPGDHNWDYWRMVSPFGLKFHSNLWFNS